MHYYYFGEKNNSGGKANPQKAEAITVKVNYFNMGDTMSKRLSIYSA